jgi:hypothetical protein
MIELKGMAGDPERIRTSDLQLRRLLLYPLSYGAVLGKTLMIQGIDGHAHSTSGVVGVNKYSPNWPESAQSSRKGQRRAVSKPQTAALPHREGRVHLLRPTERRRP